MRRFAFVLAALLFASPALAQTASSPSFGWPVVSAASTNCTLISKGPHLLTGMTMGNTGAAAWVKFYDTAVAPTAGAGKPLNFPVPGLATLAISNAFLGLPLRFTTGLGYCITGGAANADTTAVGAAQVTGTILYQ